MFLYTLDKVSWAEEDKYCRIFLICGILKQTPNLDTENKLVLQEVGGERNG